MREHGIRWVAFRVQGYRDVLGIALQGRSEPNACRNLATQAGLLLKACLFLSRLANARFVRADDPSSDAVRMNSDPLFSM
jgi:hypothetical protein